MGNVVTCVENPKEAEEKKKTELKSEFGKAARIQPQHKIIN